MSTTTTARHVPVFDDLSLVIDPKDVDAGPIALSWLVLKAVQDDVVILLSL
jgi:hypothetical protein